MDFNQREWVNDIAVGTLSGLLTGAMGALFVADPPFGMAVSAGGILGFVAGICNMPVRWLLERRRQR